MFNVLTKILSVGQYTLAFNKRNNPLKFFHGSFYLKELSETESI